MNKRAINTYIKYTARKPYLFLILLVVGVCLILFFTINTKTSLIETYNGTIVDKNTIKIDENINPNGKVHIYTNRNEDILSCNIDKIDYIEDYTLIHTDSFIDTNFNIDDIVMIDLSETETTLFDRIFIKGGRLLDE